MNAQAKILEEFDLFSIIRSLRVARFLANLTLAKYQQQMVNYFNLYSLENKTTKSGSIKYDKKELAKQMTGEDFHQPINQIIVKEVIGRKNYNAIMKGKNQVSYIDEGNSNDSSDFEDTTNDASLSGAEKDFNAQNY